jgi:hypothetical protein
MNTIAENIDKLLSELDGIARESYDYGLPLDDESTQERLRAAVRTWLAADGVPAAVKPHRWDRTCGVCGVRDIPFGVDWPWWVDGKPAHALCDGVLMMAAQRRKGVQ